MRNHYIIFLSLFCALWGVPVLKAQEQQEDTPVVAVDPTETIAQKEEQAPEILPTAPQADGQEQEVKASEKEMLPVEKAEEAKETEKQEGDAQEERLNEPQETKGTEETSSAQKTEEFVAASEATNAAQNIEEQEQAEQQPKGASEEQLEEESSELPKIEEPIGIDTVALDEAQGNWLFKRIWWERAEERYTKIRDLVQKIWESRMNFFIKRNQLDKEVFDPFYVAVGLGQGELQVILNDLLEKIEQESKENKVLTEKERDLLSKLQEEKKQLEQLKKDINAISSLDDSIDAALSKLMEQINRIREYENEAWNYFSEIARVLNDQKARELFYKMDVAWRNIKSINTYLEKEYSDHFSQMIQRAREHVDRVKKEIEVLREKGIDFKKQAEQMKEAQEANHEEAALEELEEEEDEEATEKTVPGFFGAILNFFKAIWDGIIYLITLPYRLIFGK